MESAVLKKRGEDTFTREREAREEVMQKELLQITQNTSEGRAAPTPVQSTAGLLKQPRGSHAAAAVE